NQTWPYSVGIDAIVSKLAGQSLGQQVKSGLGGVVGSQLGLSVPAIRGSHENQFPGTALDHERNHRPGGKERAFQIDIHRPVPVLRVSFPERYRLAHAGNVHQNIDTLVQTYDVSDQSFDMTAHAHVAEHGPQVTAVSLCFTSSLDHHHAIDVADHHLRAFTS